MKLTQITEHTYMAVGATATTIYRTGDDCVLIDSGHPNDGDDLIRLLNENHLRVRGILSTHFHHDHFGNCRRIAKLYNLPIILPIGEATACRSVEALAYMTGYPAAQQLRGSVTESVVGPVDEIIDFSQDSITVADVKFDVFHTPGHTVDNVSFRTPDGVLVVGDVLITPEKLAPLKAPYTTCISQDLLSKRLVAETPCAYCVMAHCGYVPAARMTEILQANLLSFSQVINAVRTVITRPMTFDEIVPRFCKERGINGMTLIRGVQMRHIVSAIIGYLMDLGEISIETALGLMYYMPVNRRGNAQTVPDAESKTDGGNEHSSSGGRKCSTDTSFTGVSR